MPAAPTVSAIREIKWQDSRARWVRSRCGINRWDYIIFVAKCLESDHTGMEKDTYQNYPVAVRLRLTCFRISIGSRPQVGHSIRSCDVPSLFRDFGIVIINAMDTEVRESGRFEGAVSVV